MSAKRNGWATAGKVILAILMLICIAIDIWYLCIKYFAPERVVSVTNEVGEVTLTDGTSKPAVEINYYSNKNKNGFEMFELKFTNLLDENRTAFYSYGLQYIAETEDNKIDWVYYSDDQRQLEGLKSYGGFWIWEKKQQWASWGFYDISPYTQFFEYQSGDDFQTSTTGATNPIDSTSMLKLTMGQPGDEQIYGMKFKWDNVGAVAENGDISQPDTINNDILVRTDKTREETLWGILGSKDVYTYHLAYADTNLFAYKLYQSIQTLQPGTNSSIAFEFGDLFNYYRCLNEQTGIYESTAVEGDLIKTDVRNYFGIKVNIFADGARKAEDSLYKCIKGDPAFNITGDYEGSDYLFGENIIGVDIYDFDFVNVSENNYALKLKDDFINYYRQYTNKIRLSIKIDLDELAKQSIQFFGFTEDSGLDYFDIYRCYTVKVQNGRVQEQEVEI